MTTTVLPTPGSTCTARTRALAHLAQFRKSLYPGLLIRLRHWRGIGRERHRDMFEDVEQELAVDCIANAAAIDRMSWAERHTRWFRLVERELYRVGLRSWRHHDPETAPEQLAEAVRPDPVDPMSPMALDRYLLPDQAATACRIMERAVRMGSGRLNVKATAEQLGVHPRRVREFWEQVGARLGFDREYSEFWTHRLVEALIGMCADRLRARGAVLLCGEPERSRPDPAGRARRLARIHRMMAVVPLAPPLRPALRLCGRSGRDPHLPASIFARAALDLAPENSDGWLWYFEACAAEGDLPAAARALHRAQRFGAEPVRVLLGRLRLLEARGAWSRAVRLLVRGLARHRNEPRLAAAFAACTAVQEGMP